MVRGVETVSRLAVEMLAGDGVGTCAGARQDTQNA